MKLLNIGELKAVKGVPYTRSHLYRMIDKGQFPKPIKLGPNRIMFIEEEIDEWFKSLMEARTK